VLGPTTIARAARTRANRRGRIAGWAVVGSGLRIGHELLTARASVRHPAVEATDAPDEPLHVGVPEAHRDSRSIPGL